MSAANRFDGNMVFTALTTDYIGWGRTVGSEASSGPRVSARLSTPTGLAWPAGSMMMVNDPVNGGEVWYNTNGTGTGWARLSGANTGLAVTVTATANILPSWSTVVVQVAAAAPVTLSLPVSANLVGQTIYFLRDASNAGQVVTIQPNAADVGGVIDGVAAITLLQSTHIMLYCVAAGIWITHGTQMILQANDTVDPANILANTTGAAVLTVLGVKTTDMVLSATAPALEANLVLGQAVVTAPDTVTVTIGNVSVGAINPNGQGFFVVVRRPPGT